jgi:2-succinyl-5-enolpyruvyl-6-hydroxy-3-cyclohexene-1-carboxylate synthase
VRSFDSYISKDINKHLTVATNRGVSGIEGFIASSCGFADGRNIEVNLVFGDISLIHDLNSLYFLKELKTPIKIIVINNFSGGIFTLLPINKETEVIKYIASPHSNTFENAAKLAEIEYLSITNKSDLKNKLVETFNKSHHCLLEIFVNNEENINVYDILRTIKLD